MNILVILAIDVLWLIYGIGVKLTKKRKHDYNLIVAFLILLLIGYFYFYNDYESLFYLISAYVIIALFAFWVIIDNLVLLFKKNVSEFDFYNLEAELEHVSSSSELLRQRFISTIELLHDGISFRDEGNIFGTDRYIELLGLENNEFTVENFENLIHKDDLPQYRIKMEKLSKRNPIYNIDYRIKKDGNYLWIKERGKVIYLDKRASIISTIKTMDVKRYPETQIDVLNNIPDVKKMYEEMQRLSRVKNTYHFVLINLSNVPQINEKYGRDFGDLMMGEYLEKLRFKFIKDNKSLFRISGIKFGLIVKDDLKFSLLDRALTGTGELLNMHMQFGGVTQVIYPNLGISESPYEGKNPDKVYQEASEALEIALKDSFNQSYCFYDRI